MVEKTIDQILHESCLDTLAGLPNDKVDMVLTSPPYDDIRDYDLQTDFNFEKVAEGLFRVLKPGGTVVWNVKDQTKQGNESGTSFRQALYFKDIGFCLFDTMIWTKGAGTVVGHKNRYHDEFEYMFVFSKGRIKTTNLLKDRPNKYAQCHRNGYIRKKEGSAAKRQTDKNIEPFGNRTNVWYCRPGYNRSASNNIAHQHPAIMPERLAEDHIVSWSNPNDLVYDPFVGSGTTAIAALKHGRHFIGSEINKKYVEIAEERIRDFNSRQRLF